MSQFIPETLRSGFLGVHKQAGDKEVAGIYLGTVGNFMYALDIGPTNMFLRINPTKGRFSLSQVRDYEQCYELPSPYATFLPVGASDLKIAAKISANVIRERKLWDDGLSLPG